MRLCFAKSWGGRELPVEIKRNKEVLLSQGRMWSQTALTFRDPNNPYVFKRKLNSTCQRYVKLNSNNCKISVTVEIIHR